MTNRYGGFVWYELMTTDSVAAQTFYGALLPWQFVNSGQTERDYTMISATDDQTGQQHGVGGILGLTPDMCEQGARPVWLGYISVPDVSQALSSITAAGGSVIMPGIHAPGAGTLAMVSDPQGIVFYIIAPEGEGVSLAFAHDRPRVGHVAWNELATPDPAAAMDFYTCHFGWQKDGEMNMGPLGKYEFLRHDGVIGALQPVSEMAPQPGWNMYFRVADIDAAASTIVEGGGKLVGEPHEVPGGDFSLHAIDPQGARFSLVGKRINR
ncbi:MAG: VOC family protein [Gammaproteobacteria bacterium]|nr:VOC family protein [Gammaproteobacteria bacterium]